VAAELPDPATVEELFEGNPLGVEVCRRVEALLDAVGPFEVRVSRSQVGFRAGRGFAYVWSPERWLDHPDARVVLSLAMGHEHESPRFKEVVHPSKGVWMHHLEVHSLDDLDDEVAGWLRTAYDERG